MAEQKIVFLDIDGTLIPEGDMTIPNSALTAIKQAQDAGHLMFVNTGRSLANIEEYLLNVGFDGFICGCGTYILHNNSVLFHHKTEEKICKQVYLEAKKCKIDIVFEATHGLYFEPSDTFRKEAWDLVALLKERYHVTDNFDVETLQFDKFITWTREDSDLEGFIQAVAPYFTYIGRGGVFSEFVPVGFSKATGIQFVLDHFNLPRENTYAIGDGNNDLPMLNYVAHSIAMGNATPTSIFDIVSFVTKPVTEDGIAYAFENYIFKK